MDIMELGAIGEMIGGIAVLVTLIYLAVQVRNSAREQSASSTWEATREMGAVLQAIGDTDSNAEIWLQGVREFEALSAAGRLRFSAIAGHFFRLGEQIYYQNRAGSIDPELWSGFRSQISDTAAYPGVQAWWQTRSNWFGEHFRSFVESHMAADNRPRLFGESDPAGPRS